MIGMIALSTFSKGPSVLLISCCTSSNKLKYKKQVATPPGTLCWLPAHSPAHMSNTRRYTIIQITGKENRNKNFAEFSMLIIYNGQLQPQIQGDTKWKSISCPIRQGCPRSEPAPSVRTWKTDAYNPSKRPHKRRIFRYCKNWNRNNNKTKTFQGYLYNLATYTSTSCLKYQQQKQQSKEPIRIPWEFDKGSGKKEKKCWDCSFG